MPAPVMLPWSPYPPLDPQTRLARITAFAERLQTRRTCRAFTAEPVPRAIIEAAIRAAGTAPSGANHQPWHFAVVSSPVLKHAIRTAAEEEERVFYAGKAGKAWLEALAPLGTDADKPYLEIAPWLIIIFGQRKGGLNPGDMKQNYYVSESVGIATGLLLASLHEAGIATLTHTPNPMAFLNHLCARPAHEKPMLIVVAGHAAPDATVPLHATMKKPLDQIASWL
ncbi:MAG: nitroreductase family protein [Polymorphobacter sp.]